LTGRGAFWPAGGFIPGLMILFWATCDLRVFGTGGDEYARTWSVVPRPNPRYDIVRVCVQLGVRALDGSLSGRSTDRPGRVVGRAAQRWRGWSTYGGIPPGLVKGMTIAVVPGD
jgi:hypothetical protein